MQKIQFSGLILFLLVLSSCTERNSQAGKTDGSGRDISISGRIDDGRDIRILLEEMSAREYIPVDTVFADESGHFSLSFQNDHEAFYALRIGNQGYATLLIKPGEELIFRGGAERNEAYSVEGSAGSELLVQLANEHRRVLDEMGSIAGEKMKLRNAGAETAQVLALEQDFDSIAASFQSFSLDFIRNNNASLSILIALYNLYGQGLPVFHPEDDLHVYRYVDSVLSPEYGELEMLQLLHAQIADAGGRTKGPSEHFGLLKGDIAPDFVSSRPDGSQISLGELRGHYVLLCFWASWSKGSREENPFLGEAWERYAKSNFRILQVSLDADAEDWKQAIAEDKLNWDQLSDLMHWDSPLADLYRLERIPANYLINPEGRIVEKDLFGEQLLEGLKEELN